MFPALNLHLPTEYCANDIYFPLSMKLTTLLMELSVLTDIPLKEFTGVSVNSAVGWYMH